eukprot:233372-Chlamydomonas_euryale.AAC.1
MGQHSSWYPTLAYGAAFKLVPHTSLTPGACAATYVMWPAVCSKRNWSTVPASQAGHQGQLQALP